MKNSIEEIENDFWGEPEFDSHLVVACHKLRKKNIDDFEIEDIRIMIGQNIGLLILIPIAINKLKDNIFAEGDFYEGDLLLVVLKSDKKFWNENTELKKEMISLVKRNLGKIRSGKIRGVGIIDVGTTTSILDAFGAFKK